MIKNGRPYTNENGWEDDDLITRLTYDEAIVVDDWIRKNIRKSRTICRRTSYGLKHILQDDTGIYMTNNGFKDAMLLAGYAPVNPNELNWRYRIELVKEQVYNTSPFFQWVKEKYEGDDSPGGDFAGDVIHDQEFPSIEEHEIIKEYLTRLGACDDAMEVFEDLWKEYERERH